MPQGLQYQLREYLSTGVATEGSLLIEKTIYDQLIKAVLKKLIPRELCAIYVPPEQIRGSSVDFDLETPNTMAAFQIAEGAPIPVEVPVFTSINIKPLKYGGRPMITKEMMEDGKWNQMEHAIYRLGVQLAENESSLIVSALAGAANSISAGASVTFANITRAIQYVEDKGNDFHADTLICGPQVKYDLQNLDIFSEANKFGSREMMETGFVGTILGLDVYQVSAQVIATHTAYVFDRNQAYAIVEKRPLTVSRFEDFIQDLEGATVTQRIAVSLLRSGAVCQISGA